MEGGEAHATLGGYVTGFLLSVVMTAIPFWLVMARPIEDGAITATLVVAFAIGQIFVHMIYFLHMDSKSEGGWTIMALIFTAVLVIICISGSLWVMYHLNQNMMPMGDMPMEHDGAMGGMSGHTDNPVNQIAPFGSVEEN
ncbi:cytochrome o ubiquinol oxidase subunit IV [Fulvimarina sp. 2208YS6-2-32]|uniref:Cytochrome bo(3) ubiquinol oxidase subunit 4 n=1 Tax=Fulvimarina uroteuthidis TaxID=3098149 RepID=A0ABU5I4A5_9HYPH|nr:cytochrome o ubiquinol oxidase subunit IV [Fulvimarina sp. 2208YS6-2-32]MDY8110220.1 cytochrome o ubiquinol oxidase subunit IV [Fulvimarina sp. 2208YS6-2-32]